MKTIRLKPGREKSVKARHPWIFSGALSEIPDGCEPGETVLVESADRVALAIGAVSPVSQITVRVWSFNPAETIDASFFRSRLGSALGRRDIEARSDPFTACRLVNAESDRLPGLIVDRYGEFLICQFLSAGAARWKSALANLLREFRGVRGIYERSDVDVREKEGLEAETGSLWGETPPALLDVRVGSRRFLVDVLHGHKTGFYLDQAENLDVVAGLAAGRDLLNCFSYTGAFTIAAMGGGARHGVNIESSRAALAVARQNLVLNGCDSGAVEQIEGDVFTELRRHRDARRDFDLIVLDPPKFVANVAQLHRGTRAYKDINLLAIKLLRPGGVLITFSCSGHVSPDLFRKIVADAALDAGREVRIMRFLNQAPDHPVALSFPQSLYLKGLVCLAD